MNVDVDLFFLGSCLKLGQRHNIPFPKPGSLFSFVSLVSGRSFESYFFLNLNYPRKASSIMCIKLLSILRQSCHFVNP